MPIQELADRVIIEPETPANACLIWLHGLGADGYDFVSLEPYLRQQLGGLALRFIFPHAPEASVTFADGARMRSWYDILGATPKRIIDPETLLNSANRILALIQEQVGQGIPPERIMLVGFSQGGAVAYQTALGISGHAHPLRLAGLAVLSTYVPEHQALPELASASSLMMDRVSAPLPILMGHGRKDSTVPLSLAKEAENKLLQLGYQPDVKTYPIAHQVCYEEMDDLAGFINHCLHYKQH